MNALERKIVIKNYEGRKISHGYSSSAQYVPFHLSNNLEEKEQSDGNLKHLLLEGMETNKNSRRAYMRHGETCNDLTEGHTQKHIPLSTKMIMAKAKPACNVEKRG